MHYEIERRWLVPDKWLVDWQDSLIPSNLVKVKYIINNPLFEIRIKRYTQLNHTHLYKLTFKTKGLLRRLEHEITVSEKLWNKLRQPEFSYYETTKAGYSIKLFNKFIIAEKEFNCLKCAMTYHTPPNFIDITSLPWLNLSAIYKNGEEQTYSNLTKLLSQIHKEA